MSNFSEELYEKYLDMATYEYNGDRYPRVYYPDYYRKLDQNTISDFYRGVYCDEFYFKTLASEFGKSDYNEDGVYARRYIPLINEGKQVSVLDPYRLEVISKYKRMILNNKRNDPNDNLAPEKAIEMFQSSEEGLYYFVLKDYVGIAGNKYSYDMLFYPNESYYDVGGHFPFLLVYPESVVASGETLEISDEDIVRFANKVYREGLPHVCEMIRSGEKLEFTDEDRAYYDGVYQHNDSEEIEVLEVDDRNERLQRFREQREMREERQEELRRIISQENENKANWYNSLDNPTNIRVEKINHLRRQVAGLNYLKEMDESLLTEEQTSLLEEGKKFLEMYDMAQEEKHERDMGMSPEIRDWYQEYYTDGEGVKIR